MIKTIIFDFGDVFLDLDKTATKKALERMEVEVLPEKIHQKNLLYEQGLISSREFIDSYCTSFQHLTQETFTTCWNAILIQFPEHRLKFIQDLADQNKYELILLSNTNDIHIQWVRENISFFEDFKKCFDAFYLSQEVNLRKPDPAVFEFVLNQHNLAPEQTLFIDDIPENTASAAKLGIHTWTLDPASQDVVDLFTVKQELF